MGLRENMIRGAVGIVEWWVWAAVGPEARMAMCVVTVSRVPVRLPTPRWVVQIRGGRCPEGCALCHC